MNNIYMLTDMAILTRIGEKLKTVRLKQNITQQSLAEAANVSLSTVKKIEKGEIRSFDAFLRILRTLGQLDILQQLVEEEQLSPSEYYTWCRHRRPISVNAPLATDGKRVRCAIGNGSPYRFKHVT